VVVATSLFRMANNMPRNNSPLTAKGIAKFAVTLSRGR
jgi:hypothetical protein